MPDVQSQIVELLGELKVEWQQVADLRHQYEDLNQIMQKIESDYQKKLIPLLTEYQHLWDKKRQIQHELRTGEQQSAQSGRVDEEPPIRRKDPEEEEDQGPPLPLLPPHLSDPRLARKKDLVKFIEWFVSPEDQEVVMQTINAVMASSDSDIGNMLELLSWGEIWKKRCEWESFEQQYERLKLWCEALQDRTDYWSRAIQHLEQSPLYEFIAERRKRNNQDWLAYLDSLAKKQTKENHRIEQEILVLEQELQKMRSSSEVMDG